MHLNLALFPYLEPLLHLHEKTGQQPDNLCGPYWISLLLQAYGGLPVSAVEVALSTATVLPSQGDPSDWLPSGANSFLGTGYDRIPTTANLEVCGTSATGLVHATQKLSQGQFCLLPLQADNWIDGLNAIWDLCSVHPDWQIVPILNVHTRYLWSFHLTPPAVFTYLQTGQLSPSLADWEVGHFSLLVGQLRGDAKTLYAILDTYPHFGWNGLHFQPPEALARSLQRPGQATQGGIALFMATELQSQSVPLVEKAGLRISSWDNGSPDPFCPH